VETQAPPSRDGDGAREPSASPGQPAWHTRSVPVPVIERYRPEVIAGWEDFCYNHGMLLSPAMFRDLCAPHSRRVAEVGRDCGAELLPKVPAMLAQGGYFPMFDHALQTEVGFDELCRCMTLLHELCGSEHLGEFPRRR